MNLNALSKGQSGTTKSEDRFGTPVWLVNVLQRTFGRFTHDLAAEPWSSVAPLFITKQMNVLKNPPRAKHGFGNWPYGRGQLIRFVPHAREQVLGGRYDECTQLVPHYTAEGFWQFCTRPEGKALKSEWRYSWIDHPRLKNWTRLFSSSLIIDVIAIKGRLEHRYPPRYAGKRSIAPFSSAVVRFSRP